MTSAAHGTKLNVLWKYIATQFPQRLDFIYSTSITKKVFESSISYWLYACLAVPVSFAPFLLVPKPLSISELLIGI